MYNIIKDAIARLGRIDQADHQQFLPAALSFRIGKDNAAKRTLVVKEMPFVRKFLTILSALVLWILSLALANAQDVLLGRGDAVVSGFSGVKP
ncbi:MAG: hypothetical protein ACR2PG_19310, partial [Hyphomicrobiaceae bacterium]